MKKIIFFLALAWAINLLMVKFIFKKDIFGYLNILTILMVGILLPGCDEKEENNQDVHEIKAFIESVNLPDSFNCCETLVFTVIYGLPNHCYEFSRITKSEESKNIKYNIILKNESYNNKDIVCPSQYIIDSIQLDYMFGETGNYIFSFNDSTQTKEVIIY